jgi:hypothetical protein
MTARRRAAALAIAASLAACGIKAAPRPPGASEPAAPPPAPSQPLQPAQPIPGSVSPAGTP